jgi:hypothetical protein
VLFKTTTMATEFPLVHPELRVLAHDIDEQLIAWGLGDLVVTDILRRPDFYPHKRWSWHFCGCAIDIRTRDYSKEDLARVFAHVKAHAGPGFDVVLEGSHLHVEIEDEAWRQRYEAGTA